MPLVKLVRPRFIRGGYGVKKKNEKKSKPTQLEVQKEHEILQLYAFYYAILGGPENVVVRESSVEEIDKYLKSTEDDLKKILNNLKFAKSMNTADIFNILKKFLEDDLFTSTKALRARFSDQKKDQVDVIVATLQLKEGSGLEIPERDLPPATQRILLHKIKEIVEGRLFKFLDEDLGVSDEGDFIDAGDVEICKDMADEFLMTEECWNLVKSKNPELTRAYFSKLISDATLSRNQVTHRTWVTTDFIIHSAENAVEIINVLNGNEDTSVEEEFLLYLVDEMKRWQELSAIDKKETIFDLRSTFDEIEKRPSNRWLHAKFASPDNVKTEKRAAAVKMIEKRQAERFAMGKEFGPWVLGNFGKPAEEMYPFPLWKKYEEKEKELKAGSADGGEMPTQDGSSQSGKAEVGKMEKKKEVKTGSANGNGMPNQEEPRQSQSGEAKVGKKKQKEKKLKAGGADGDGMPSQEEPRQSGGAKVGKKKKKEKKVQASGADGDGMLSQEEPRQSGGAKVGKKKKKEKKVQASGADGDGMPSQEEPSQSGGAKVGKKRSRGRRSSVGSTERVAKRLRVHSPGARGALAGVRAAVAKFVGFFSKEQQPGSSGSSTNASH